MVHFLISALSCLFLFDNLLAESNSSSGATTKNPVMSVGYNDGTGIQPASGELISSAEAMGESLTVSELWGASGEKWSGASRLPDFSLAGYAAGQKAIPEYPVQTTVKEHGAKGDGVTDDTAAFQRAISAVGSHGAVLIPAGRYVISDVLELNRSHVVLRGEGPDRSVLVIPKPLSEIRPLPNVDGNKSAYSFTGGFISMSGTDEGKSLGEVSAPATRGDTHLQLTTANLIKPGDWIRLIQRDSADQSLSRHFLGDVLEPGTDPLSTLDLDPPVDWAAQVIAVDGNLITLNRPLRFDVRPEWNPEVFALSPTLHNSGIENLGFEFSGIPKMPHLQEVGFNAIHLDGAVDCWIRNITITDADNGIIMRGSYFCTVDGFTAREKKRTGLTGHHALWVLRKTQDVLFINFRIETKFVHDLTVEGFANGNVFTKGFGVEISCDHHRCSPYENLFTDFDAGNPRRLFESSGRADRGPHSGTRTTFWGIRGSGNFPNLPPAHHWPLINIIGFGQFQPQKTPTGPWVEPDPDIHPINLWEAQARYRAEKNKTKS